MRYVTMPSFCKANCAASDFACFLLALATAGWYSIPATFTCKQKQW